MEENEILNGSLFKSFPKFIIPFGLICNIIVYTVFSRNPLRKVKITVLIKVIAINNILNLIIFIFWSFDGVYGDNLYDHSVYLCKIVNGFSYIFNASNNWTLVYISIDRLILIVSPKIPSFDDSKNFHSFDLKCIVLFSKFYLQ